MKFTVKITQVLEGFVEIEAENSAEALNIADARYRQDGAELPDMENNYPLQIRLEPAVQPEMTRPAIEGAPTKDDIEKYLICQGYPHPSGVQIDEFLFGGENQAMYDEAVKNEYPLCDVDRWFHLKELVGEPISFKASVMIDSALWEEEYELMEMKEPKDLFDTPEGVCKTRIQEVISDFGSNAAAAAKKWANKGIRKTDAEIFARVFKQFLLDAPEQKQSLSSLIDAADSRSASNGAALDGSTKPLIPTR